MYNDSNSFDKRQSNLESNENAFIFMCLLTTFDISFSLKDEKVEKLTYLTELGKSYWNIGISSRIGNSSDDFYTSTKGLFLIKWYTNFGNICKENMLQA